MYSFFTYTMMFLQTFVGLILVGIILLQRGRGGGLAGALGGMGGQSAFGNKAGDLFTRITVVLATVWIILSCVCVLLASNYGKQPHKIGADVFAKDQVKQAPEAKPATDDKKDDLPVPDNTPEAKSDAKTDVKAEAAAESKAAKPDDTKPAATDKPDETKKDEKAAPTDPKPESKDEGAAKPEAKEDKPAEPADKDSAGKKSE